MSVNLYKNNELIPIAGKAASTEVVDKLDSDSATAALSAKQGKILNEKLGDVASILDSINRTEV